MKATILIEVNLPLIDPQSLLNCAADFEDDLVAAGHDIISAKPYAHPSVGLTSQQIQSNQQQPLL